MKVYRTVNQEPKIKGIEYIHFFVFLFLVLFSTAILVNVFKIAGLLFGIILSVVLYFMFKGYSSVDRVKLFAKYDRVLKGTFKERLNRYFSTQKVRIR